MPALQAHEVHKRFREGREEVPVLNGISLDVGAGRVTGLLSLIAVAIALTACGGSEAPPPEPKIPARLAADWAAQADAVAASLEAGDPCGARDQALALQAEVADAINAGRIPAALRPELQETLDELVQIECVPPKPPPEEADPCEALEERKKQLEEEKKELKEIEDEEERKAREAEIEAEKKAVEEELKACKEAENDD